jgi:hypothetical protein
MSRNHINQRRNRVRKPHIGKQRQETNRRAKRNVGRALLGLVML